MAKETESSQNSVTIEEFAGAEDLGLQIEILQPEGIRNEIRSQRVQKLGLALAGFSAYIHSDRIQILGGSEINYLSALDPGERIAAIRRLSGQKICCVLITKGIAPPAEMLELARNEEIPILRSNAMSSVAIARITRYLEGRLAPQTTVHGVLLDIFGLGVLLLGPSGIGKSECALELVLKGHRLISDDSVVITRRGLDRLVGSGGKVLKYHMELRGLGIINIRDLFGVSAIGLSQTLDLAIRLQRWKSDAEYDRLGLEESSLSFLGVSIPIIEMPVGPGRNVSTLVEVAARIHLLRQRGYQPSRELLDRMDPKGTG